MSVIKPNIVAMSAYAPPLEGRNPDAYTLLDFNERTIPVSEPIKQALIDYIQQDRLQMYPAYGDMVARLADYNGIDASQLMITNGSDQGIDLVFRAVSSPGLQAIIPGPSFAMYPQCAGVEGLDIVAPNYSKEGGYPVDEVLAAITDKTAIIVIANPNNPSGTLIDRSDILAIAKQAPTAAILVDECYFEYTRETVIDEVDQYPNLFVTRTFSKTWGLPSVRFGYLISAANNINALCNMRGPYDVNQLAIVAAQAALDNAEYTVSYVNEVMHQAKPMLEDYLKRQAIVFWPSAANYLWVFPENPRELNDYLSANGILVRPKSLDDQLGLRITIGTVAQVEKLLGLWSAWLAN